MSRERDPARAMLTQLLWRWIAISLTLAALTAAGEWLTPYVLRAGRPQWLVVVWTYGVYMCLGLAIGFALLALMTAHQRSQLKR